MLVLARILNFACSSTDWWPSWQCQHMLSSCLMGQHALGWSGVSRFEEGHNGLPATSKKCLTLLDFGGLRYEMDSMITSTSRWAESIAQAPAKAKAELAALSQCGLVDVVLTMDVDTLIFGVTCVAQVWFSPVFLLFLERPDLDRT